ncbi:hypothetical protein Ahu01nite_098020 [Winogradskya humida]|uniref:DUF5689 domain-containing protein n=1 Tax=Winogradskya humida TaxID=113566 RepID=A0ABQ4A762_9ACTN|nr:hypothetical protein Ahu01nite_098020 [Actinoplanes humidus]
MIGFSTGLIAVIQEQVRKLAPLFRGQDSAQGILVYRDASGLNGTAIFDGSEVEVPVRISGVLDTRRGQKVALLRTGAVWSVVGVLSMGGMGEANRRGGVTGSVTKADGAYADIGGIPSTSFAKLHATSAVRIGVVISLFSTVATTKVEIGARITGTAWQDGTAYDSGYVNLLAAPYLFNAANDHRQLVGMVRQVGMPPGDYSVVLGWRRNSGSGTLTIDTNDCWTVEVDEIRRQAT